ncbi:MAPEG family protein [Roseobacter sp. HKCCA0434]|uniref:MAPEG family protein n=1 Tax=Roseobacter sp. HKCCA0434 TaxID=3079297 RepID=UPI002905AD84|nr:MAPEG family protein [Roseobacter sp. HKCCA0434]
MSAIATVAFYAGLNGLVFLWLFVRVMQVRRAEKVWMGDAGNKRLIRAQRGQGNFVEIVPFALIQMTLMSALDTPVFVLHLFGIALTLGRVLHARHFTQNDAPGWQRMYGTILSLTVILLGSLGLIAHALI